jgi:hypothetical protein
MDRLDLKCVITQLVLTLVIFYVAVLMTATPLPADADLTKPRQLMHDSMLYVMFGVSILIGNVLAAMLNNGCPQKSSLF